MTSRSKAQISAITGALLAVALIFHFTGWSPWNSVILFASTVIAGFPIGIKAFQSLKMRLFSIELLVSIAIIGALLINEYVESAVVSFLFIFGAYLEARTLEQTRASLKTLLDMAPVEATVLRNGERVVLSVDDIVRGDHLFIQSGEKVAADGKIVAGSAFIREAAITGESVPVNKKAHDTVFGGTLIENGYIEVLVENIGDNTTYAKIIALVEEAQESKTKTEKFLEKFSSVYTPAIIVLSAIVYIITRNIEFTLTFLVIACPGALVISAPVSIVAGIGNGARSGILIKGGEVMEKLAKINTVVFDKTGTLTQGQPAVTDIMTLTMNENELLQLVAEAEVVSEHHLGQTIVQEANKRGLELVHEPEHVEVIAGYGIRATVSGKPLVIGNRKLLVKQGVTLPQPAGDYALEREKQGNTAIFAVIDGRVEGVISIADAIRPEALTAIEQLKEGGVKEIYMLTGDNRHVAEQVAGRLGISHVLAEMLPGEKAATIAELKEKGYYVAMIGDGINDAPAIATADIGLSMNGSGTDAALETADVVLMADKLDRLGYALSLAKSTVRNMKQNTYFAVGTVVLLLIGVVMQKVFLASGMFIHELSVFIVILNAIRIVRYNGARKLTIRRGRAIIESM